MRPRPAIILYVEQNEMLLQTVRDVVEFAGWYVGPCSSERYAVAYVESGEHSDLLLIDYDSRNFSGLALTERARRRPHRRETPVAPTSPEDIKDEAERAPTLSCGSRTTSSNSSKQSGDCSTRAARGRLGRCKNSC